MMVAMHQADGFVSGTNQSTGSVLRPLFQIIKVAPQATTASSCQVMEVEDSRFGENGVLLMGDCGVIPDPTVEQLADIAVSTAQLARQLVGVRPRVALLSFSTKGSSTHPSIGKVQAATALAQKQAHEKQIEADFDGELQVDAALVPEIAARKLPENKVAGHANVLIFPDLNSGNIASKLVRHIARANAYGQILLGLDRPAADVSRGSNAHDILGVAAIVGVQSIDYHDLYPGAGQQLPGEQLHT
jgi:phosphate acetyltransferase